MGVILKNGIEYGAANMKEITWNEYQELTQDERNSDTVYYITDIDPPMPDKFRPVIYSEAEQEIGVWVDGKPLYEKTIHIGSMTYDTNWHDIAHNIENIDKIIYSAGYVYQSSGYYYFAPHYRPQYNLGIAIEAGPIVISYVNNWLNSVTDSYITLRYTKTTDTAGSGKWTPQGIPVAHYSEGEQIVGTWIDGKTLYQKTIDFTCENTSSEQRAITFSNNERVQQITCFFKNSLGHIITNRWNNSDFWQWIGTNAYIAVRRQTSDNNWQSGVHFIATIQYTKVTN